MFQKSFVRFKNGYVVTFDTLIVENVYQSPSNSPEEEAPSQPPPKGEEKTHSGHRAGISSVLSAADPGSSPG